MVGFRAARVEADLGFAEYKLLVQHRESWVSLIPEILPLIYDRCWNSRVLTSIVLHRSSKTLDPSVKARPTSPASASRQLDCWILSMSLRPCQWIYLHLAYSDKVVSSTMIWWTVVMIIIPKVTMRRSESQRWSRWGMCKIFSAGMRYESRRRSKRNALSSSVSVRMIPIQHDVLIGGTPVFRISKTTNREIRTSLET